jgi:hypothetical protein
MMEEYEQEKQAEDEDASTGPVNGAGSDAGGCSISSSSSSISSSSSNSSSSSGSSSRSSSPHQLSPASQVLLDQRRALAVEVHGLVRLVKTALAQCANSKGEQRELRAHIARYFETYDEDHGQVLVDLCQDKQNRVRRQRIELERENAGLEARFESLKQELEAVKMGQAKAKDTDTDTDRAEAIRKKKKGKSKGTKKSKEQRLEEFKVKERTKERTDKKKTKGKSKSKSKSKEKRKIKKSSEIDIAVML